MWTFCESTQEDSIYILSSLNYNLIMNTSEVVQWSEKLSVGIKEIDDQHKHFIGIVNKLHESVEKGDVTDELDKIFVELNDYAAFHFETEEKYFENFIIQKQMNILMNTESFWKN